MDNLKKLLGEIAEEKSLPEKIYFCGDVISLAKNWKEHFKNFSELTIFNKPLVPEFFSPESIKHYFDFSGGFSSNNDAFLLLSALFANNFLGGGKRENKTKIS